MDFVKRIRNASRQTWEDLREAEIPLISSSLAFSTLFSLIPFIAVGLVVLKGFSGFEFLGDKFETLVYRFFRDTAGPEVGPQIRRLLERLTTRSLGITSALALFVTSFGIFLNMEDAVNRIWGTRRERRFWKRLVLIFGFYALIPLGFSVYAGFRSFKQMKSIFAWSPLFWDTLIIFIALLFVNRLLPATRVSWRTATIGAGVSTVGLALLQVSFSWMTKSVFHYSALYGSLAALPIFCLWILMAWQFILLGVSFAASLTRLSKPPRLG
ncbi:MAG TPA: YihY/virulence factor BrkB family protein [Pseudobdellovibrionaceae bacterium]|nr:YihY/virulence factor BrkB family protein [Pseudobdellovibrionaceae bacterium]